MEKEAPRLLTDRELTIIHAETIIVMLIFFGLFALICLNSYLFLYKNNEYKNVHSAIFYFLSLMCVLARFANLYFCYKEAYYWTK